jgi:hypothetical protein
MAQKIGNEKNILVGASPLFLSIEDSQTSDYKPNMIPGTLLAGAANRNHNVPAFAEGVEYWKTLNELDVAAGTTGAAYRNVGYTNNGLQITYNPTYDSVTVDQLLDTAKLFKSAMEVMIATEMSEGTLENVLAVFGQAGKPANDGTGLTETDTIGLEAGALGAAPVERQLVAVGQAPTAGVTKAERIYYGRRVLSVQQSQFSLARTTPTTFPVTFRLLPSGDAAHAGKEYGLIIDRTLAL